MEKSKIKTRKSKTSRTKENTKNNKVKKVEGSNVKAKLEDERLIKALEKESEYINSTKMNEKMINEFYKFHKRKIKRGDFYSLLLCGLVLIIIGINFLLEGKDYFLIKTGDNKDQAIRSVEEQDGTPYCIVLSDGGKTIRIFEFEWAGSNATAYYDFTGQATK